MTQREIHAKWRKEVALSAILHWCTDAILSDAAMKDGRIIEEPIIEIAHAYFCNTAIPPNNSPLLDLSILHIKVEVFPFQMALQRQLLLYRARMNSYR